VACPFLFENNKKKFSSLKIIAGVKELLNNPKKQESSRKSTSSFD